MFSADKETLLSGGNYIMLGNEVLQYMTATYNSPGAYTLSNFIRGRRGTEWAMGTHSAGEKFAELKIVSFGHDSMPINSSSIYSSITIGLTEYDEFNEVTEYNSGTSLKPFSPAYVRYTVDSGSYYFHWMRRDRYIAGHFRHLPLSEDIQEYTINVYYKGDLIKNEVTTNNTFSITEAELYAANVPITDEIDMQVCQNSVVYGEGTYATVAAFDEYLIGYMYDIMRLNPIQYQPLNDITGSSTAFDVMRIDDGTFVGGTPTFEQPSIIPNFEDGTSTLFDVANVYLNTNMKPSSSLIFCCAFSFSVTIPPGGFTSDFQIALNARFNMYIKANTSTLVFNYGVQGNEVTIVSDKTYQVFVDRRDEATGRSRMWLNTDYMGYQNSNSTISTTSLLLRYNSPAGNFLLQDIMWFDYTVSQTTIFNMTGIVV